jgi:hypothetical protein
MYFTCKEFFFKHRSLALPELGGAKICRCGGQECTCFKAPQVVFRISQVWGHRSIRAFCLLLKKRNHGILEQGPPANLR